MDSSDLRSHGTAVRRQAAPSVTGATQTASGEGQRAARRYLYPHVADEWTGFHTAASPGEGTVQPRHAPRVWVDDENPIFRRGLVTCLGADGFDVVGESTRFTPEPVRDMDVLVFAAEQGGLARAVHHSQDRATRLVALVNEPVEKLVGDAVEAGVAALLIRPDVTQSALTGCVRSALTGHATLPTDLLDTLLDGAANGSRHNTGGLTPRELSVLRLLAEGSDTKEIAGTLSYSERTVKNVVHDVLMKMNCNNRAHAVAVATRQGII